MMKKVYKAPVAEKVTFNYTEQVVASGNECVEVWTRRVVQGKKCADEQISFNN